MASYPTRKIHRNTRLFINSISFLNYYACRDSCHAILDGLKMGILFYLLGFAMVSLTLLLVMFHRRFHRRDRLFLNSFIFLIKIISEGWWREIYVEVYFFGNLIHLPNSTNVNDLSNYRNYHIFMSSCVSLAEMTLLFWFSSLVRVIVLSVLVQF